jgi:cytochrome c553
MRALGVAVAIISVVAIGMACRAAENRPVPDGLAWAYPSAKEKTPFIKLPAAKIYHVEGSALALTGEQITDSDDAIDWIPGDHPIPPPVVFPGNPATKLEPCAGCHEPNGLGFLGAPNLTGLPAAYITEQVREFRAGRRRSSIPDRPGTAMMIAMAQAVSDQELEAAAGYYGSQTRHGRSIRVIETATVPATQGHYFGWLERAADKPDEPIANRIILIAEDFERLWIGDPHAMEIAYVPPGSIQGGEQLVRQGEQPCTSCHGATLKGAGDVPPLAGRDPTYLARALWDIKSGARNGPAVDLMQAPASRLDPAAITSIAAYLSSLEP